MSSEAEDEGIDLFQEPTGFYEPEKQATYASHQLLSGKELTVRLVGHNPLWVSRDSYQSWFSCINFKVPLVTSFYPGLGTFKRMQSTAGHASQHSIAQHSLRLSGTRSAAKTIHDVQTHVILVLLSLCLSLRPNGIATYLRHCHLSRLYLVRCFLQNPESR